MRLSLVVPYVGTWIEISYPLAHAPGSPVVPYVGTWIEIDRFRLEMPLSAVVPYVGTWIEIGCAVESWSVSTRRSLRGNVDRNRRDSHIIKNRAMSFPTWERG